jgi:hypothetical protein
MTWYADAHAICEVIAEDTGLQLCQVAALVAIYSVQTVWASTVVTAAVVAERKTPVGGAGSGAMATEHMKAQAQRILNGDHYDAVIRGRKTNAFAHLIFHGGESPEGEAVGRARVCIDKHAYSVACGARATDAAYAAAGLQSKARYEQAANHYREAAKILSKQEGRQLAPHQIQAATWIVRQRLNEEDEGTSRSSRSRSAEQARRALERMQQYLSEHHHRAALVMPGSGYSQARADRPKMQSADPGPGRLNTF